MSILSYLEYLVSLMSPDVGNKSVAKSSVYIMTFIDDTSGIFNGPYFKIIEVDANIQHPEAYQIDIGYPGSNYVFGFNVDNDQNYSIIYDYQTNLHPDNYVTRLDVNGDPQEIYSPSVSSGNT